MMRDYECKGQSQTFKVRYVLCFPLYVISNTSTLHLSWRSFPKFQRDKDFTFHTNHFIDCLCTTEPTIRLVWPAKTDQPAHPRRVFADSLIVCAFYSLQTIQRGIIENPCHTWWMYKLILVFAGHSSYCRFCRSQVRQYLTSLLLVLFFFFFFDFGFTVLSRVFHILSRSFIKVDENRRTGENHLTIHKQNLAFHMWPKRDSNHSGEKPNGLRVDSSIH